MRRLALSTTVHEQARSNRACNICNFVVFALSLGIRYFCITPIYWEGNAVIWLYFAGFFFALLTLDLSNQHSIFGTTYIHYHFRDIKMRNLSWWTNSIQPGQTARVCRLARLYTGGKRRSLLGPTGQRLRDR